MNSNEIKIGNEIYKVYLGKSKYASEEQIFNKFYKRNVMAFPIFTPFSTSEFANLLGDKVDDELYEVNTYDTPNEETKCGVVIKAKYQCSSDFNIVIIFKCSNNIFGRQYYIFRIFIGDFRIYESEAISSSITLGVSHKFITDLTKPFSYIGTVTNTFITKGETTYPKFKVNDPNFETSYGVLKKDSIIHKDVLDKLALSDIDKYLIDYLILKFGDSDFIAETSQRNIYDYYIKRKSEISSLSEEDKYRLLLYIESKICIYPTPYKDGNYFNGEKSIQFECHPVKLEQKCNKELADKLMSLCKTNRSPITPLLNIEDANYYRSIS